MIPYSLRNLKMLNPDRKSELTNDDIKELFQDYMLKTSGVYIHCDQVTSDINEYVNRLSDSYDLPVEIFWADFCEDNKPMYSRYICELSSDYYFNIDELSSLLEKDMYEAKKVINNYTRGIVRSDACQCSTVNLKLL